MRKILLVSLCLFSCSQAEQEVKTGELYFSLEKLVEEQVSILSSGTYQIKKTAFLNEKHDEKILKPDSLGWLDELKLFRDADINLPSLRGVYEMVAGPGELTSNLQEIDFIPVKEVQGVQYIKVFYAENRDDVRKIETRVTEVNSLFRGETILKLELRRDGENNLVLTSYEITGGQKMIMLDSVEYKITGLVTRL
ncbi:MAG TPA: hypothetical protein VGA21_00635 [Cyclobacteriaceae bacterium]|jgi:hypothetical protein